MKLHVMVSILLCSLVSFLNGLSTEPQILRQNSTIVAFQNKQKNRRVQIAPRYTANQFNTPTSVVESGQTEESSDDDSNGTESYKSSPAVSPAMSPQPQPVLEATEQLNLEGFMDRKNSFPELNRTISPLTLNRSLEELGSPWNKSGSGSEFDHPIPTPKKENTEDHRLSTPSDRHPVPTPDKK